MCKRKKESEKKRNASRIRREQIKVAMSKKVFFTLTNYHQKLKGVSNKYSYKANMHSLIFKGGCFSNVRHRASIITRCNFNETDLTGVDFCNCNLKGTTFKKAKMKNVCFINCNIKDADFENVVFVCTRTEKSKNLTLNEKCKVYTTYPKIFVEPTIQSQLLQLARNENLYEPHVIYITKNKLNLWILNMLEELYGKDVYKALVAISNRRAVRDFFTVQSYMKHIENYLKL